MRALVRVMACHVQAGTHRSRLDTHAPDRVSKVRFATLIEVDFFPASALSTHSLSTSKNNPPRFFNEFFTVIQSIGLVFYFYRLCLHAASLRKLTTRRTMLIAEERSKYR